ncbi:MAG: glycerol-3-phosphate 1-O-acyltransferase PlsY [Clostridia bacterium]|nr:glycerol-3-phosphate 1-O-acyltransferase PlsY [Clostridia bacterium]
MNILPIINQSSPLSWVLISFTALCAYFIGSINFSIILSRAISGKDIRESGSGNAGATNMLRTHGKGMGVLTLLLDVLKGVVAVLIAMLVIELSSRTGAELYNAMCVASLTYLSGLFVIIGHNFPIFFGFKGGKGVATALGVVMMLNWKIGIVVLVIAITIMAVTRYVSLGSIIAAALFVVLDVSYMFFLDKWNIAEVICVVFMGAIIVLRHHANIKRLMTGTENKLGAKKKEESE